MVASLSFRPRTSSLRASIRFKMKTQEQIEARRKYAREYDKKRRVEDPEYASKAKAARARYRASEKGRTKELEYRKNYSQLPEVRERQKHHSFKALHGVTRDQADQLIAAQKGLCAICKQPPSGKGHCSRLHVDHCHSTGKIRGALCVSCNAAIGQFNDSIELLELAADYLASYNTSNPNQLLLPFQE